jgi:hypothetical protein
VIQTRGWDQNALFQQLDDAATTNQGSHHVEEAIGPSDDEMTCADNLTGILNQTRCEPTA